LVSQVAVRVGTIKTLWHDHDATPQAEEAIETHIQFVVEKENSSRVERPDRGCPLADLNFQRAVRFTWRTLLSMAKPVRILPKLFGKWLGYQGEDVQRQRRAAAAQ